MSVAKAIEIVSGWPSNRSAPKRLAELIKTAKGQEREQMGRLVEVLIVASQTASDEALVDKYFG